MITYSGLVGSLVFINPRVVGEAARYLNAFPVVVLAALSQLAVHLPFANSVSGEILCDCCLFPLVRHDTAGY